MKNKSKRAEVIELLNTIKTILPHNTIEEVITESGVIGKLKKAIVKHNEVIVKYDPGAKDIKDVDFMKLYPTMTRQLYRILKRLILNGDNIYIHDGRDTDVTYNLLKKYKKRDFLGIRGIGVKKRKELSDIYDLYGFRFRFDIDETLYR